MAGKVDGKNALASSTRGFIFLYLAEKWPINRAYPGFRGSSGSINCCGMTGNCSQFIKAFIEGGFVIQKVYASDE